MPQSQNKIHQDSFSGPLVTSGHNGSTSRKLVVANHRNLQGFKLIFFTPHTSLSFHETFADGFYLQRATNWYLIGIAYSYVIRLSRWAFSSLSSTMARPQVRRWKSQMPAIQSLLRDSCRTPKSIAPSQPASYCEQLRNAAKCGSTGLSASSSRWPRSSNSDCKDKAWHRSTGLSFFPLSNIWYSHGFPMVFPWFFPMKILPLPFHSYVHIIFFASCGVVDVF